MSRLRLAAPAVLLLCATALAACGGGGSASSTSASASGSATTGSGTQQASLDKFRSCLKDQGVTLPSRPWGGAGNGAPPAGTDAQPPAGTNGRPAAGAGAQPPTGTNGRPAAGNADPKVQKAIQACAQYRPQGQGGGFRGGGDSQAFTAYLSCLKDNGLKLDTSTGFRALRNLDRTQATVKKALAACQSKLPQRAGAAPGGTRTSTPS